MIWLCLPLRIGLTSYEVRWMKKNVYQRSYELDRLKEKPKSDYSAEELVAFLTTAYPGDPIGALKIYMDNFEIGFVLYKKTKVLLEGLQGVKRD